MIPKLQIALDNTSLEDALKSIIEIGNEVDVIEVGTILNIAEGSRAVKVLRSIYPDKIIISDIKGADAGSVLAKICFDAGADLMTAICSADIETMVGMKKEGEKYDKEKEIQVELYGDWTFVQAQKWLDNSIEHVIYHRSRDAETAGKNWGNEDMEKIKKLSEMGFKVTVTGGLTSKDVELFKGLNIYCFIGGRGIRNAHSPIEACRDFKREINKYWS